MELEQQKIDPLDDHVSSTNRWFSLHGHYRKCKNATYSFPHVPYYLSTTQWTAPASMSPFWVSQLQPTGGPTTPETSHATPETPR